MQLVCLLMGWGVGGGGGVGFGETAYTYMCPFCRDELHLPQLPNCPQLSICCFFDCWGSGAGVGFGGSGVPRRTLQIIQISVIDLMARLGGAVALRQCWVPKGDRSRRGEHPLDLGYLGCSGGTQE
jgi:hypothetical protein